MSKAKASLFVEQSGNILEYPLPCPCRAGCQIPAGITYRHAYFWRSLLFWRQAINLKKDSFPVLKCTSRDALSSPKCASTWPDFSTHWSSFRSSNWLISSEERWNINNFQTFSSLDPFLLRKGEVKQLRHSAVHNRKSDHVRARQ